jgi:hypothetical protein
MKEGRFIRRYHESLAEIKGDISSFDVKNRVGLIRMTRMLTLNVFTAVSQNIPNDLYSAKAVLPPGCRTSRVFEMPCDRSNSHSPTSSKVSFILH